MGADPSAPSGAFHDPYGRLLEEFAGQIGEEAPPYGEPSRSVREEVVRCVWFGGHFRADGLSTDDGRRLEVLSPGWWNVEGGPDFARAELLIEGAGRLVGDVEVHTFASGWYAHGHHRQPAYAEVALHVVMWNDRDEPTVRAEGGRPIPQLTLSRAVEEDLEELVEIVDPDSEPAPPARAPADERYCARAAREGELDPEWLARLLDAAGDHRLLGRAAAVAELFANHPREQLLYERIAEALGYKSNRMPFLQLAGLLPLADLRRLVPPGADGAEKALRLEAALFALSGFLDGVRPEDADQETRLYAERLRAEWRGMEAELGRVRLTPDHWQLAGVRPANHPARRIAALARLCAAHLHEGLFACFVRRVHGARPRPRQRPDVATREALLEALQGLKHPYWSHRYTFGARRLDEPRALIGSQRAMSIVVDVLLPMLLAHARSEGDAALTAKLHELWCGLPRRPGNVVTRRMEATLFAGEEQAREVVGSARRQQGLHQLYRDCCHAEARCDQCVLYLARRAGKAFAAP